MLKQRVITALVLVFLVLCALFAPAPFYWQLLINGIVLIGFWEWLRCCEIKSLSLQTFAYIAFVLIGVGLQSQLLSMTLVIIVLCAIWAMLIVFTLTRALQFLHQPLIKLFIGLAILPAALWLLVQLRTVDNGAIWILRFFVAVIAADIGAYFVGKRFGKTKLAPAVSPGKTVEGLLGGLGLVLLIFTPVLFSSFAFNQALFLLLTVFCTAVMSVLGDLFISKLKRHAGLKDSSQILPGHGGVLDRIDSLLAAAPVFSLGLLLLGYL